MNRIQNLQKKLRKEKLAAFLVTNSHNIFYLTGFRGLIPEARESILLVDEKGAHLYIPRMYRAEARKAQDVKIHILPERTKLLEAPVWRMQKYRGEVGFEAEDLKYAEYQTLKAADQFKELESRPSSRAQVEGKQKAYKNFVSDLRQVKDRDELHHIKKAVHIADQAFKEILRFLRPGLTEKQIARKIIEIMEDLGAEDVSFPPIVASGKGSALPHHRTSNKKIKSGEPVLLDFGAKVNGYCSDLTRMLYAGKPSQKFTKHYNLVLKAQKDTLSMVKPGIEVHKLHEKALKTLAKEAKYMLHGVGHGVGLEVHEKPFLRSEIKDKLEEGMVVTIEPGLYYEGRYGIRIEDYGVVTGSGFQLLSIAPKELLEIGGEMASLPAK